MTREMFDCCETFEKNGFCKNPWTSPGRSAVRRDFALSLPGQYQRSRTDKTDLIRLWLRYMAIFGVYGSVLTRSRTGRPGFPITVDVHGTIYFLGADASYRLSRLGSGYLRLSCTPWNWTYCCCRRSSKMWYREIWTRSQSDQRWLQQFGFHHHVRPQSCRYEWRFGKDL